MKKNKTPINKVVEAVRNWEESQSLVRRLNDQARACRALAQGLLREACFIEGCFPLIADLHSLGFSLEYDPATGEYSPIAVYVGEEGTWAYPTIRLRPSEP